MINLLTQFPDVKKYDLSRLEVLAYGGSPMAPELIQRTRELLPEVKLSSGLRTQRDRVSDGSAGPGAYGGPAFVLRSPLPWHRSAGNRRIRETSRSREARRIGGSRRQHHARVLEQSGRRPALAFRDGLFRTGDIGYQDSEGYFYILDRLKDMIVTGGENVYSGEVEAVIYAHPAVREAAVFGIPDPKWGELVMACVVLKPGSTLSLWMNLSRICRQSLASLQNPAPRRVPRKRNYPRAAPARY